MLWTSMLCYCSQPELSLKQIWILTVKKELKINSIFFCPNSKDILLKHCRHFHCDDHYRVYCSDWRRGKHGSTHGWLCQEAGGGPWYWLMLICFASMLWCVSIGSGGRGIARITFHRLNWAPRPAAVGVDTRPLSNSPRLSSLIMCQRLTLTGLGINQRWQTTVTTTSRRRRSAPLMQFQEGRTFTFSCNH